MVSPWLDYVLEMDDWSAPAKQRMRESRLVVVDYVSTAHLESMAMDIPTVVLWQPERYRLAETYPDYFARLTMRRVPDGPP
jgi:putative transferase (TIGR04331 family)